mmetsp:Transcript_668/g.1815  ORF Transcript_668/g.1815 Transcript_668/m.1815 type:complete len:203 (-) Transcript_668:1499-2107(-)
MTPTSFLSAERMSPTARRRWRMSARSASSSATRRTRSVSCSTPGIIWSIASRCLTRICWMMALERSRSLATAAVTVSMSKSVTLGLPPMADTTTHTGKPSCSPATRSTMSRTWCMAADDCTDVPPNLCTPWGLLIIGAMTLRPGGGRCQVSFRAVGGEDSQRADCRIPHSVFRITLFSCHVRLSQRPRLDVLTLPRVAWVSL